MVSVPLNIRLLSLIILSIQTSTMVLLLRYSRTAHSHNYLISTAVLLGECIKFLILLSLLLAETGYVVSSFLKRLKIEVILNALDTSKLALPAGLYVVQNNLLFVALTNLDAATYQVTYQLKILTTAVFSWVMLGRRLTVVRWFSLTLLMIGVSLVQVDQVMINSPSSKHENSPFQPSVDIDRKDDVNDAHPNAEVKWLLGVLAVFVSCISSGFAGVYFEALVKTEKNSSLIIRNIQLGLFSLLFASVAVYGDRTEIRQEGFFQGYNPSTWLVVTVQALGGLIVSVTMKYADNILKGFATSISIVISTLISWTLLGEKAPTFQFLSGSSLVIAATFIYGSSPDDMKSVVKGWHTFYTQKKLRFSLRKSFQKLSNWCYIY